LTRKAHVIGPKVLYSDQKTWGPKMIGSQRSCKKAQSHDQVSESRHVPGVTRVRGGDALDLAPRMRFQIWASIVF
jgi:hypothetical protein